MQIPVQQPVAGLRRDLADRRRTVLDQAPVGRVREAGEGRGHPFQHGRRQRAEVLAQLRRCGYRRQTREQTGDHEGRRTGVRLVREGTGRVETLQEQGAGPVVVLQKFYGAVARPGAQRDRLARGLLVEVLEFQRGPGAVGAQDGEDQGAIAVHRGAVEP